MVKRSSRIPRVHAEITNEAAQAFRQALKLRDHRETQLADDKQCKGVGLCEVCDEYERLVAVVDTALDVKPFELSPVDVIDAPPPPMWTDQEQAAWNRARDLHVVLAKAAKMEPLKKGLLTDGCRGQANVRWCERTTGFPTARALVNRSACSVRSTAIPPTGRRSMPC
jgi:hypothetical protein